MDTYTKCHIWLLSDIMEYANTSFSLIDLHTYGTKNKKTGKLSGLVGNLSEGLVDIGVSPLLINEQRIKLFHYITAVFHLNAKFVFRRPTLSKTNNIFLLPFDKLVWTFTIVLIGLVIVLMTLAVLVEWRWYLKASNKSVLVYNIVIFIFCNDIFC